VATIAGLGAGVAVLGTVAALARRRRSTG
jgi:hypothetical protein